MEREELMGKCLYNGIKLEELPESTHPFAFMWTTGEEYVLDAVAEKPATYLEDDGQLWISFTYGDRYSNAYLAEDTWNIVTPSEGTAMLPASMIVWTNFDLCKEDGTVVLAASEPVPVVEKFPLRQLVEWILPGWGSRPLPMGAREPVAYLYNGVRLPGLPEDVDTTEYSHVFFYKLLLGKYYLYFAKEIYYQTDVNGQWWVYLEGGYYTYNSDGNSWSGGNYVTSKKLICTASQVLWANFNVLDEDGTVYLAASEPVPVYE